MALKTYELQIDVSPKMGKPANTGVTVESFDKDSVLFKITLTQDYEPLVILATDKIQVSVLKYGSPSQKIVLDLPATTGETISWYPPELLDGYAGRVRVGVYLTRGAQKVAAGYFNFDCKVSDIDADMDAIEDNVFTSFTEFELALAGYQAEAETSRTNAQSAMAVSAQLVNTTKESAIQQILANVAEIDELEIVKLANDIETAFWQSSVYTAQVDQRLLQSERLLTDLNGISGVITLTNTQDYPFNNSGATIPIAIPKNNLHYRVDAYVVNATGGFVEQIVIYDKQVNGFKIRFDGSAKNVELRYQVVGGMYK